ncbi:response regulator [Loktanella sp. SALINAS62]|uniref:response regulator n=1 Tax=Loktanella sp. SALINAS62 TaxID=2706124 RepID=UPI001B8D3CE4|nr:response regulator [Loktanella sp. SALINAS62]MBS1303411.1 response regulator [Loktanella sp. SALINAS62]
MTTSNPPHSFAGRRILVVEDERLIALDVRDILEKFGCVVLGPVATVDAALQLINDENPEAAVLDVQLNGETSEPVAHALRLENRPFLVLTAYSRRHLTGALEDAPLLNKPVDERKLRASLSDLFS